MIVVDLEMSGLYPEKHGIFEIGAVDTLDINNVFFDDCRIDDDDMVSPGALRVTGKTEEGLRSREKQSQEELLVRFFRWMNERKEKVIICQNFFDTIFLQQRARKYGLDNPIHYRSLDLHTIGHLRYLDIQGEFILTEGYSDFGLSSMLEFVGMFDNREAHNALEDAKLEAECFSRLVYGKGLFEEYQKFEIPEYLKKDGGSEIDNI